MTMNRHWGFDRNDHEWKSSDDMLRILVDVVGKGGNLLLNVGPDGDGVVPAASVGRLRAMGDWLRVNGEAVHGAGRTAFGYAFAGAPRPGSAGVDEIGQETKDAKPEQFNQWGHGVVTPKGWRCTTKPGVLYIHLLDDPGGTLSLPRFPGRATGATLLDGGAAIAFAQAGGTVTLTLPAHLRKAVVPVVKITYAS